MQKINHRQHCGKTGKCVICGRPICRGCNAQDKNGTYGICIVCNAKIYRYKNDVLLPIRPLFRPLATGRLFDTCNDDYYTYGGY